MNRKRSLLLFLLLIPAVFAVFVHAYGPDSSAIALFNSDAAIPVLMSNQEGIRWFDAYYWGQDRFGSLPFLLLRAAAILAGTQWTPESVQVWLLVWVFAGGGVFALLFPEIRRAALAGFLFLAGCPFFSRHMFEIAQFFPWQFLPLFASLLLLRRITGAGLLAAGLAGAAVFYAVWASPLNLVFIVSFLCVEGIHDRTSGAPSPLQVSAVRAAAVASGAGLERLLRRIFHETSGALYGNEYRTMSWVNRQEIPAAVREAAARMLESPELLLLDAAGLAALLYALRAFRAQRAGAGVRTAAALGIGALLQLPLLVSIHHFTVSGYPDRFFFLLHFGLAQALLAVVCLHRSERLKNAALLVLVLAGFLAFRAREPNAGYAALQKTASDVCKNGGLLAGSYWQTYVYAALARDCRPHPFDGVNRMPWIRPAPGDRGIVVEPSSWPSLRAETPAQSGDLRYAEFKWVPHGNTD